MNQVQAKIAQAEAAQLLLEDKKEQLQKEIERSENLQSEMRKLQKELDKERSKSWIQKLFIK